MTGRNRDQQSRLLTAGGVLVGVGGVLLLIQPGQVLFPIDADTVYVLSFGSLAPRILTGVVLFVGFLLSALARREGEGLTGAAQVGTALLSAFGLHELLSAIGGAVIGGSAHPLSWFFSVLIFVTIAAGIASSVFAWNARVADRSTRVLLVAAPIILAVITILRLTPILAAVNVAAAIEFTYPTALILLGAALAADRRHAVVRQRFERVISHR